MQRRHFARLESLEPRLVLTAPTLAAIPAQTLSAGAPLEVPINAASPSGYTLTYSVTSSNSAVSADLQTGHEDLVLNITHTASTQSGDTSFSGTIVIELFPNAAPDTVAQIVKLVEAGAYNGKDFYRIVPGFVAQAGLDGASLPSGVTDSTLDDEFNPALPLANPSQPLQYTSEGVVGLARTSADDSGSTEFFITTTNTSSFLDYQYTVFGQVVSGMNILNDIANVPNNASNNNLPYSPVTITSAAITTDNNDFALGLSAPIGTTGTSTVTVTANDGHGGTTSQSFQVTVQADPNDPGPVLNAVPTSPATITTSVNTPVSFQLSAFDLEGDPITYYDQTGLAAIASDYPSANLNPTQSISPNLNVTVNSTTGMVTVTPTNGLVGVTPMFFGVASSSTPDSAPNTEMIPLFIDPAAPTGISLEASSDTGSSNSDGITALNNSSASTELSFLVTGVTAGDTVILYDGGKQIGSSVAGGTSVVVTTNGSLTLANGTQQITAEQVLENQKYTVGNQSGTTSLASAASGAVSVTVEATGPTITAVSTTAAAHSTFNAGQPITIDITFNQAVNVTGTPQLNLNDTGMANYVSGSGTATLAFTYTPNANQNTTDLDYSSTAALVLNGGTIDNVAGVAGVLTLPATGTDGLATQDITVSTPIVPIDLAVAVTATTSTLPGGSIAYTVTVSNKGTSAAQTVTLSDTLPTTVSFASQKQTSGSTFTLSNSGNVVTDTIANLAAGASASFTIMANVPITATGTISDTATVSSPEGDSNPSNNTATASTTVTATGVMLLADPTTPTENDLVVGGTSGADNVSFTSGGVGKVTVTMDGKSYGTFAVTGRIVAYAGAGNDTIVVNSAITLPTFLYAGSGSDELVGGSGNNVLVGGSGSDTLIGGTGHNILIAGTGASKLYSTPLGVADAAANGSIIIAGTTTYNNNQSALATIMAEWASSDSYATRVAKIGNGTLAGGVELNTSTIIASKAADELFASTGADWFWELSPLDQILNLSAQKKATTVIN